MNMAQNRRRTAARTIVYRLVDRGMAVLSPERVERYGFGNGEKIVGLA